MDPEELRALQLVQLKILTKVDEICRAHGITYYLVGGTLLGAIRHKGFIPWDDDVDIAMYREDYERFLAIAQNELGEEYFVQTWKTEKNYGLYFSKVRVNGTLQVEEALAGVKMHHGVFIDIFPLDRIPTSKGVAIHLRGWIFWMLKILKVLKVRGPREDGKYKTLLKTIRPIARLVPNLLIGKLQDFVCTYTNSRKTFYTTSFSSGYGWKKQCVPHGFYGHGVEVEFEGRYFNAPQKWHLLLTQLYGDYMKVPPIEKRGGNHVTRYVDLGEYKIQLGRIQQNSTSN